MDSDDSNSDFDNDFSFSSEEDIFENPSFEILTPDQVVKCMDDIIAGVSSVVQISSASTVRALLNHFKWNQDVLMDRLYGDDQEKLFEEMKIANPFSASSQIVREASDLKEQDGECGVCYGVLCRPKLISLECGHTFCSDCWKGYLNDKIMDQGVDTIACLEYECNVLLEQEQCLEILQNSRVQQIYKRLVTNNFVESNSLLTWCRNPNCDKAIKVVFGLMQPITCSCNDTFCFKCGEDWHSPQKCDLLQKWLKSCKEDSGTSTWLMSYSKNCPKCQSPIEKNGGCNHMTCGKRTCQHVFCWICLAPSDHYLCECGADLYEDPASTVSKDLDNRNLLKRYIFYYDLYMNHENSLQLEENLVADVEVKVDELQKSGVSVTDSLVLKQAVIILRRCRKTLLYTYPFAFYLKQESNQTEIFRNNQADLQRATEKLSGCLEHELDEDCFTTFKLKLIALYQYCENRRKILEQHVDDDDIEWIFMENLKL